MLTAAVIIGTAVLLSGGKDDFSTIQPMDPCLPDGCEPTMAAITDPPSPPVRATPTPSRTPTASPTPGRTRTATPTRPPGDGRGGDRGDDRPGRGPDRPDWPGGRPDTDVDYRTVSSEWWGGDFEGSLTIVNRGDRTLDRWELRFSYDDGRVTDLEPGNWRREGDTVIVSGGAIPPGGRVVITYEVDDGRAGPPDGCSLNGRGC
ncbi:hypothetical protein DPM19_18295 [Actinomadura craniellae]|uniref:CBM2 domain-containing protein n=1 Tax=Actinomadura craniellae TaxID=2231787 RepID=A0A365H3N1_9ACTN|nr:cellulose binding domain-containing protein [Actinomadura craniellae]RAY13626.1 hypothetical protein DPM19_18295 [Actinomadura craniellae]